jgi:hypothetical protein
MDEKNVNYVHITLDDYAALVERAVRAECEADQNRTIRWKLQDEVDMLRKTVEALTLGKGEKQDAEF